MAKQSFKESQTVELKYAPDVGFREIGNLFILSFNRPTFLEQKDEGEAATQETTQKKIILMIRDNMKYNPAVYHRRSIRLQGYDYSRTGVYFITLCAQHRDCLFGEIMDGEMRLNDAGKMVQT
jgi:hypothetical protein